MTYPSNGRLSDELASHLVATSFPELGVIQVTERYEGMDHFAVEMNQEWIFRFPKTAESAPMLPRELRLLPIVAPVLPVAVPRYEWVSPPLSDFPFTFAGYRKLGGTPAIELPP